MIFTYSKACNIQWLPAHHIYQKHVGQQGWKLYDLDQKELEKQIPW